MFYNKRIKELEKQVCYLKDKLDTLESTQEAEMRRMHKMEQAVAEEISLVRKTIALILRHFGLTISRDARVEKLDKKSVYGPSL